MLPDIMLSCPFGDENKKVVIHYNQFGAGDWTINIDGFYYGSILFSNNKWQNHLNPKTELTLDDFQILAEIIEIHLYSLLPK